MTQTTRRRAEELLVKLFGDGPFLYRAENLGAIEAFALRERAEAVAEDRPKLYEVPASRSERHAACLCWSEFCTPRDDTPYQYWGTVTEETREHFRAAIRARATPSGGRG